MEVDKNAAQNPLINALKFTPFSSAANSIWGCTHGCGSDSSARIYKEVNLGDPDLSFKPVPLPCWWHFKSKTYIH